MPDGAFRQLSATVALRGNVPSHTDSGPRTNSLSVDAIDSELVLVYAEAVHCQTLSLGSTSVGLPYKDAAAP